MIKRIFLATAILLTACRAEATVPNDTTSDTFNCSGVATEYAYSFKILSSSHILVTVINPGGVATDLTLGVDYTVSGVGLAAGGNITLTNAALCPSGYTIILARDLPYGQPTSFRTQGTYSPGVHENAFDRLSMQILQLKDKLEKLQSPTYTRPAGSTIGSGSVQFTIDSGSQIAKSLDGNVTAYLKFTATCPTPAATDLTILDPEYWPSDRTGLSLANVSAVLVCSLDSAPTTFFVEPVSIAGDGRTRIPSGIGAGGEILTCEGTMSWFGRP